MICNYCGAESDDQAKSCLFCGQSFDQNSSMVYESSYKNIPVNENSIKLDEENSYTSSSVFYQRPNKNFSNGDLYILQTEEQKQKNKNDDKSIISLACGVISIFAVTSIFFSLPIGICGIVFFFLCKEKNTMNKAGLITSIIGSILSVLMIILFIFVFYESESFSTNVEDPYPYEDNYTYEDSSAESTVESDSNYNSINGNGFRLPYDSTWTLSSLKDGTPCINYNWDDKICFLSPMGEASLSESGLDFFLTENQETLYSQYRSKWDHVEHNGTTISIFDESYGFLPLNSNTLYAYYDFGTDENELMGRYYLLMDVEKNALLSFMVSNPANSSSFYTLTESVLRDIEIYEE